MAMHADTAKYVLALDDEIQALWRSLEHHSTAAEHRERAREWREKSARIGEQTDQYRTELASHIQRVNEEATRYVNIVSVIGYAGYFATWSFTKDLLGRDFAAFVGLMGMVSVSIFVLWEMFQVFLRLRTISELGHVFRNGISVEDFEPLRADMMRRDAKAMLILTPIHRFVFAVSFLTMIAGGFAMMFKLYASL